MLATAMRPDEQKLRGGTGQASRGRDEGGDALVDDLEGDGFGDARREGGSTGVVGALGGRTVPAGEEQVSQVRGAGGEEGTHRRRCRQ